MFLKSDQLSTLFQTKQGLIRIISSDLKGYIKRPYHFEELLSGNSLIHVALHPLTEILAL